MPRRFNTGEVDLMICLATAWLIGGRENISVSEAQAAEYQRDPDGFAARYYGMTLEQYYEWIESRGVPLCAATTKSGKPCKAPCRSISSYGRYSSSKPADWLALHRIGFCAAHTARIFNFPSARHAVRE